MPTDFSSLPILVETTDLEWIASEFGLQPPETHADQIWINKEGETITIEMVRQIQAQAQLKPFQAETVTMVILSAHLATTESQNALLKLLEEPPTHLRLILTTDHISSMLPTVVSRTVVVEQKNRTAENTDQARTFLSLRPAEIFEWTKEVTAIQALEISTQLMKIVNDQLPTQASLAKVAALKNIQQAYVMLKAKTNHKLVLEWLKLNI